MHQEEEVATKEAEEEDLFLLGLSLNQMMKNL
jgi:hypothetical protein